MSGSAKKQAYRFGQWAETLCCWRLRLTGYAIVARRYKVPVGEIDIVARRGNLIAFIEVKGRRAQDQAAHALPAPQRRRIEEAAAVFLSRYPDLAACSCRFDLMTATPWRWPRHLQGAWLTED